MQADLFPLPALDQFDKYRIYFVPGFPGWLWFFPYRVYFFRPESQ